MFPSYPSHSVVVSRPLLFPCLSLSAAETWRGVADELSCRSYDRKRDYLNMEETIIARQSMQSLYTGKALDRGISRVRRCHCWQPPPLRTVHESFPSHSSSKPVTDWLPQMARPLMAGVLALTGCI